ncbi:MAG: hypothetical protein ABEH64_08020 [Salinirussus sp.]
MNPGDEEPTPEPEEGPVLVPEELDITEDDHVTQIDETRYVISPEERPDHDPAAAADADTAPAEDREDPGVLDRETVHDWIAEDLSRASSRYGFDITASFDESEQHRRMVSNDVVTIFESLVLWYAQQIDADTPVEEVLGILLWESNVPVRYPARSLQRLVESTGLGPQDSIGDLLAAVDEDEGVQL